MICISPSKVPVNEPVNEPVFVANSSFESLTQIEVPSTLTPIELPSINLNRSPLNVACPLCPRARFINSC